MRGDGAPLAGQPECPWCEHELHMAVCECGCETSAHGYVWAHRFDDEDEGRLTCF